MDRADFLNHLNAVGWIRSIFAYCLAMGKDSTASAALAQICTENEGIYLLIMADLSEKYEISILQDKNGRIIKYF